MEAPAPPSVTLTLPAAPRGTCERCGAAFEPRRRGGHRQLYCSRRCRDLAHKERLRSKAELDEPEPPEAASASISIQSTTAADLPDLAAVLQVPMPAVEAPGRVKGERGYNHSLLAEREPIRDDQRMREARTRPLAGDKRFIEAMEPRLAPAARQRAKAVVLQDGDPAARLLGSG